MDVQGTIVVVTGGGNGIGRAVCESLADAGAAHVIVADRDESAANAVAQKIGGTAVACDVGRETDVDSLVNGILRQHGRIDLFISNAGVTTKGGAEVPTEQWQRLWDVNVMAHVHAARAVLPAMLERGQGYLVSVASAAGLLTEIGSAPYSVTKHAAVAFAEWLSVQYQKRGIKVSCVCPAGVATDFLDLDDPIHRFLHLSSKTPQDVATNIIEGIRAERFLILPHPEVGEFFAYKGVNYDGWLKNFARLNEKLTRQ